MTFDRRTLLAGGIALPIATRAVGADPVPWTRPADLEPAASVPLWPDGHLTVPAGLVERVTQRSDDPLASDRIVEHVVRPRIDVFRPENPNGAAIIVAPGGGYRYVVIDKEGYELARWLTKRGVTVCVLFYRLPGDSWAEGADTPLADAQRAMRLVRNHALGDAIDPARVAFCGFSAGGHLAASLLTRFDARVYVPFDDADARSARPDALAAIYPVVSMDPAIAHVGSRTQLLGEDPTAERENSYSPERHARADQPPLFLVHAEDDGAVRIENSMRLRDATRAAGGTCEAHFFERGEHGFGLMKAAGLPVAFWPELLWNWLGAQAIV